MSPEGLSPIAFGLIRILQSHVGPQLKRAETKTELSRSLIDLGDGGAPRKAKIADGKFDGRHGVSSLRGSEMIASEESLC